MAGAGAEGAPKVKGEAELEPNEDGLVAAPEPNIDGVEPNEKVEVDGVTVDDPKPVDRDVDVGLVVAAVVAPN